jgi:hypothetical protein
MRHNWLSNRIFKSFDNIVDPLLLCLEYPHRSALENHVRHTSRLGRRRSVNLRIGVSAERGSDKNVPDHGVPPTLVSLCDEKITS